MAVFASPHTRSSLFLRQPTLRVQYRRWLCRHAEVQLSLHMQRMFVLASPRARTSRMQFVVVCDNTALCSPSHMNFAVMLTLSCPCTCSVPVCACTASLMHFVALCSPLQFSTCRPVDAELALHLQFRWLCLHRFALAVRRCLRLTTLCALCSPSQVKRCRHADARCPCTCNVAVCVCITSLSASLTFPFHRAAYAVCWCLRHSTLCFYHHQWCSVMMTLKYQSS